MGRLIHDTWLFPKIKSGELQETTEIPGLYTDVLGRMEGEQQAFSERQEKGYYGIKKLVVSRPEWERETKSYEVKSYEGEEMYIMGEEGAKKNQATKIQEPEKRE